jgi:phosphoribosyl-AMP cyclohydrolase
MKREYFEQLEALDQDYSIEIEAFIDQLAFDEQGLIPVITQDSVSRQVLMFAWMNKASLNMTLSSKRVTYWSRSRQQFWIKGETSGHIQSLVGMSFDCDGDAILCEVEQLGAACHTGRRDCFYLKVDSDGKHVTVQAK